MDAAVTLGLAGLAATCVTSLGGYILAQRQSRIAHLRQLRIELYLDLAQYIEAKRDSLETLTSEWGDPGTPHPGWMKDIRVLSARVWLLAPGRLRTAWSAALDERKAFKWHVGQEEGIDPETGTWRLSPDDDMVVRQRAALVALERAVWAAARNPDR